jgi:hypothetical protein
MTQVVSRNNPEYIRILELISKITEEWGETVSDINMYHAEPKLDYHLNEAIRNLEGIHSPLHELQGLLEVVKLKKNVEK